MTCREASKLLSLFFDGELDARQMRAVALHDTRCPDCEPELRRMERLQELISDTINARIDETELTDFWPAIERQLGTVRLSWWERARVRWSEGERRWVVRLPALAAAAAIAALALLLLTRAPQPTVKPDAPQLAAVDNSVAIDTLETEADSAIVNDPETRTTVIWVGDNTPAPGDVP